MKVKNTCSDNSSSGDPTILQTHAPCDAMAVQAHEDAVRKLREAGVLQSLKKEIVATVADDASTDADTEFLGSMANVQSGADRATNKLQLRHTIVLNTSLVDRFIAMPRLPRYQNQKNNMQSNNDMDNYELSCDKDLDIWHACDDPVKILNNYPFHSDAARAELPYFVLWALHDLVPAVYQTLIGEVFGPVNEPVRHIIKVLPEPIAYDHTEPPFEFKHGLVLAMSKIHPIDLVHTYVSGTTGAGKTYGGVKPLLQSFLIYHNAAGKKMAMLVIDPKSELLQICANELHQVGQSERLFRTGAGQRIRAFSDSCELGLEDRYRTLAGMVSIETSGDASIWQEKGHRLNLDMLAIERRFQLQTGYLLWGVVRSLIEDVDHTHSSSFQNIHAIYKHALISKENLEWLAAVSSILTELCPGLHGLKSLFATYLNDHELQNQLYYRVSNAEQICKDLSSDEVACVVNTDLFADQHNDDVSVAALIDQGKVILHQPSHSHTGDITGRLVKARFFADTLSRKDMKQPIGYIADEFQQFITSDRDTGEQSFLDRCRAFRVNCVLASQSLASIEHALGKTGERAPRLVVDIIIANSPTKLIYRTLDATTHRALKEWIPPAPDGRQHVVDIRPPAQLPIGNAYYLCNGAWGMYRYEKTA